MKSLIRTVFNFPQFYNLFQNLVIPKRSREIFRGYISLDREQYVIDFGCGLGNRAQNFSGEKYLGIDISPTRINLAKEKFGNQNVDFNVGNQMYLRNIEESSIDLLFGFGILHHLDNNQLTELSQLSYKVLKKDGRLLFIEPLVDEKTTLLAKFIIKLDVGQFARDSAGYSYHFSAEDFSINIRILEKMLHIPYRHVVIECKKA